MVEDKKTSWIEVWPFNEQFQSINPYIINSEKRILLNRALSGYCDDLWKPKAEKGWKNSWIAFVKSLGTFWDGEHDWADIEAGAMHFHQVDGIVKSIEEEKSFAPEMKYSSCLSVGFLTATKDGKVIFQRRAPDVHCPNVLIQEPTGYMTSLAFAPRAECDNPEYANDSRLFSLRTQLDFRKAEIAKTFGLNPEAVEYRQQQDLLACGWRTKEMYFSTTGRVNATEAELTKPQRGEFFFVPFEYLKPLIHNQGRLSKVNPEGYRPEDPREIPLIDESLIGLIYGYEKMTGDKLNIPETLDRLRREGLEIAVHHISAGTTYTFPTSF